MPIACQYHTCCNCCGKKIIRESDLNRYSDFIICNKCYTVLATNIHNYSYKPCLVFKGKSKLHVGIELEIQGSNLKDIRDFLKHINDDYFYVKRDGSLNNYGIEIVSMPLTFKLIKSSIYKTLFKNLVKYKLRDINNCGLHFHLDRNYFSPITTAKLDYICNNFNWAISQYCGRNYDYNTRYCKTLNKEFERYGHTTYTRYCACNLENEKTIELRFCASTSDYIQFITRVNLIESLINIAQEFNLENIIRIGKTEFYEILTKYMNNRKGI